MTTVAGHPPTLQSCPERCDSRASHRNAVLTTALGDDAYDLDHGLSVGTPPIKPVRIRLCPSPSPPPEIHYHQVTLTPPLAGPRSGANCPRPFMGDPVLINYMDNGHCPDLARAAGAIALPYPEDVDGDSDCDGDGSPSTRDSPATLRQDLRVDNESGNTNTNDRATHGDGLGPITVVSRRDVGRSLSTPTSSAPDLRNLAANALQVCDGDSRPESRAASNTSPAATLDAFASSRQLPCPDDRRNDAARAILHPSDAASPRPIANSTIRGPRSSPAMVISASGVEIGLPPLQIGSPCSEPNDKSLPPLRSLALTDRSLALTDMERLRDELPSLQGKETVLRRASASAVFPGSPNGPLRLKAFYGSHISPPVSPDEYYLRSLPSPHSQSGTNPFFFASSSMNHRPSIDYNSSATGGTPNSTDQSTSTTPATSTCMNDRMSIEGIANSQSGPYLCTFPDCTAPPFQTQYLLNSHANVHSLARPHYCSVPGCPRGEGGRGFKRKNEMIRHGLVHDSPGYVCPFCPDREHKYPRPDNLQRYASSHVSSSASLRLCCALVI